MKRISDPAPSKPRVEQGDTVRLTEAPEGFRITPYAPEFARQMASARKLMKKHRKALRELAH